MRLPALLNTFLHGKEKHGGGQGRIIEHRMFSDWFPSVFSCFQIRVIDGLAE